MFKTTESFDGDAATTKSLLGYGVLVGPVYLSVGVLLGMTRNGFHFAEHALSLLMLGENGWMQRVNLAVSGLMVLVAALGMRRAAARRLLPSLPGALVGGFGGCLVASALFAPDPVDGFPPGTTESGASAVGVLHLVFGALGFMCVVAAAVVVGRWHAGEGHRGSAHLSQTGAGVILIGFLLGAALSAMTVGIVLLWVGVVAVWVWLGAVSIDLYRRVPHPMLEQRKALT